MIENATYYYVIYQATAIAIIVELVKIKKNLLAGLETKFGSTHS